MTDIVLVTLIQTAGAIGTIVITAIVNYRVKKMTESQTKISEKQEVIHKQIDGQQEALLSLTRRSSEAEGHLKGKEEGKAEAKTEVAAEGPKEVIVVNKETEPVPIKKTDS